MGSISGFEWVLVILAALIFLGPKRLPGIGAALGKTIREFKQAAQGLFDDSGTEPAKVAPAPAVLPPEAPIDPLLSPPKKATL